MAVLRLEERADCSKSPSETKPSKRCCSAFLTGVMHHTGASERNTFGFFVVVKKCFPLYLITESQVQENDSIFSSCASLLVTGDLLTDQGRFLLCTDSVK